MFRGKGVDHVGIGVADMDAALEFFGQRLGFSEVLFDHTCDLPGLEELTHRRRTRARVAMLGQPVRHAARARAGSSWSRSSKKGARLRPRPVSAGVKSASARCACTPVTSPRCTRSWWRPTAAPSSWNL